MQVVETTPTSRAERIIELVLLATPIAIVIAFGTFGEDPAAAGAPAIRVPAPGEALLVTPADPERQATFVRERELRAQPDNMQLAIEVARRHIEDARRTNNPRALGWADATLTPWYAGEVPTEVLLLRATIRQSRHDFKGALGDLDEVLRRDPTHAQAALTRATVLAVIGRPADAVRDCDVVAAGRAPPVVGATCHATLAGLMGQSEAGIADLDRALAASGVSDGLRAWALGTRGELRMRLGQDVAAEADLRAALALTPSDSWTLATLSDLLLDAGRGAEVPALIGTSDVDNLVLRRALGRLAGGIETKGRNDDVATLRARHAAAHEREDAQHLREEARLVLAFDDDPARALKLAVENWGHQREPSDVRVALEAAIATKDPVAVQPVIDYVHTTGLRDAHIDRLITTLGASATSAVQP